ncbi:MAG: SPFH domain-containing protein [Candidatus Baltobacteraceae bacterium]
MQFIIVFFCLVIGGVLFYVLAEHGPKTAKGLDIRPTPQGTTALIASFVIGIVVASAMVFVPFGTNDLVTRNGSLTDRVLLPGLNFKAPIIEGVYPMNMQMRALEIRDSAVFTRDQQNAQNDLVINFSLQDNYLRSIASQFKGDDGRDTSIASRLIQPRAEFYLKQIEPKYDAASLLTHRADVANALQRDLEHDVSKYGITLAYVSITNISFGAKYQQTSEERAAAEQEYQKELTVLKTKKVLADQNVETAKGQARANEAIRQSFGSDPRIADALVRMRMIELLDSKWHGDMPQALGSGSLLGIGNVGTAPSPEPPK